MSTPELFQRTYDKSKPDIFLRALVSLSCEAKLPLEFINKLVDEVSYFDGSFVEILEVLTEEITGDEAYTCTSCSTVNDEDSNYCKKCGLKLIVTSTMMIDLPFVNWDENLREWHKWAPQLAQHVTGDITGIMVLGNYSNSKSLTTRGWQIKDGTYTEFSDVQVSLDHIYVKREV